jgi:hypothetical protein
MPYRIHQAAVKKQMTWDVSRPQELVPETLREGWSGTPGGGLPVEQIPFLEFPRVVYMHPNEPFETIEHRNDKFEVVSTDTIPTEHLTKVVHNETELKAAMEEGWVKEPYVPKAAPPRNSGLYGSKKKAAKTASYV